VERIIKVESTGIANKRNKLSSATGAGQFVDDTWLEAVRKHRRDLIKGRSDKELLELRRDAELTREIITRLVEQYARCVAWMAYSRHLTIHRSNVMERPLGARSGPARMVVRLRSGRIIVTLAIERRGGGGGSAMNLGVERDMTDNGACYKSIAFRKACKRLRLKHIRTRSYTPKTNGKAERFIQTR
jgi:hypothetical protein